MPTNYVDPYGLFNWFSGWWGIGGPSDEELRDQEQNTVNFLNQRLGTDHHYISQFTPSERAQIESQLGRRIVWPESAESAIRAGYSERVGFSDASHASLKVSERANQAAGVVAGAGSLKQIGTNVIEEVVGVPNPKDLVDAAKGLRKAADDIPCPPKTDYVVTPDGTAIPTDKNELLDNLSKLDDQSTKPGTSRKLVGEDSQGPIRVRIEKPHGTDPNYTGPIDPLHDVDHMHIERRRNGTSGPWTDRRGGGRKEKVPIEWPFEE